MIGPTSDVDLESLADSIFLNPLSFFYYPFQISLSWPAPLAMLVLKAYLLMVIQSFIPEGSELRSIMSFIIHALDNFLSSWNTEVPEDTPVIHPSGSHTVPCHDGHCVLAALPLLGDWVDYPGQDGGSFPCLRISSPKKPKVTKWQLKLNVYQDTCLSPAGSIPLGEPGPLESQNLDVQGGKIQVPQARHLG